MALNNIYLLKEECGLLASVIGRRIGDLHCEIADVNAMDTPAPHLVDSLEKRIEELEKLKQKNQRRLLKFYS